MWLRQSVGFVAESENVAATARAIRLDDTLDASLCLRLTVYYGKSRGEPFVAINAGYRCTRVV